MGIVFLAYFMGSVEVEQQMKTFHAQMLLLPKKDSQGKSLIWNLRICRDSSALSCRAIVMAEKIDVCHLSRWVRINPLDRAEINGS